MKITRWQDKPHGPLSEAAVRARYRESLHRVFRRQFDEPTRLSGIAGERVLIVLDGEFQLVCDGRRLRLTAGDVVEVHPGPFVFEAERPVSFMAVYRLPADQWPN